MCEAIIICEQQNEFEQLVNVNLKFSQLLIHGAET